MAKNIHWKSSRNGPTTGYWRAIPWGYAASRSPTDPPVVFYFFRGGTTHEDIERIVQRHQNDNKGLPNALQHLDSQSFDIMSGVKEQLDRLGGGAGTSPGGSGNDLHGQSDRTSASGGGGGEGGSRPPAAGSQTSGRRPGGRTEGGVDQDSTRRSNRDWRGHRGSALNEAADRLEDAQEKLERANEKLRKAADDANTKGEEITSLRRRLQELGIEASEVDKEIKKLRDLYRKAKSIRDLLEKVPATLKNLRKLYKSGLRETSLADLPYSQRGGDGRYPSSAGDPVSLFDGAFLLQETDVSLPGRLFPLAISRHYSNQTYCRGSFGWKWTTWIDASVRPLATGTVYLWLGDGTGHFITRDERGHYTAPPGLDWMLSEENGGFRLTNAEGAMQQFDASGRIQKFEDRFGNRIDVVRNASGRATELQSLEGQKLRLAYDGDRITSVSDGLGRKWRYLYDARGHLIEVALPATSDLPEGRKKTFSYRSEADPRARHQLVGIRDHDGSLVLENVYGAGAKTFNRVVRQSEAGQSSSFDYTAIEPVPDESHASVNTPARSTIYKDARGVETRFEYDIQGALLQSSVRATPTQPWQRLDTHHYDANGNRVKTVRPRGNALEFTYDNSAQDSLRRRNLIKCREVPADNQVPKVTEITYGAFNQVESVKRADGKRIAYKLSPEGLPIATTMPPVPIDGAGTVSPVVEMRFNSHGQPLSIKAPEGQKLEYEYVEAGQVKGAMKRILSNGATQREHRYDAVGRVTATIDELGNENRFEYDALDQLQTVHGPSGSGQQLKFHYDSRGLLVRRQVRNVDAAGKPRSPEWIETTHRYDLRGRETERRHMQSPSRTVANQFEYDAVGQLVRIISPDGAETVQEYDILGRVTRQIFAPGVRFSGREAIVKTEYDANGNLVKRTDPLGHASTTKYDGFDRPIAEADAFGNEARMAWDELDRVISVEGFDAADTRRTATTVKYDAHGNILEQRERVFSANGVAGKWRSTKQRYDKSGRPVAIVTPLGGEIHYTYDSEDRVTSRKDGIGNLTRWERNKLGQVTTESSELVDPTSTTGKRHFVRRFGYDRLGRQSYQEDGLGNRTTFHHDGLDALVETVLPDGTQEGYDYDLLGRLIQRTTRSGDNPSGPGHSIVYRHDAAGRVTHLTDQRGKIYRNLYDALGRPTSLHLPDGTVQVENRYDAAGNLIERRDSRGVIEQLAYDRLHRLVSRRINTISGVEGVRRESFEYDFYGRITRAKNDDHEISCQFDSLGRLHSEAVDGHAYRMHYDSNLMPTRLSYPNGFGLTYRWDDHARLTALDPIWPSGGISASGGVAPSGPLAQFDYLGNDTPVRLQLSNGTSKTWRFDAAGRATSVDVAKGRTTLEAFDVLRNGNGKIAVASRAGFATTTHEYDSLGRLVETRRKAAGSRPKLDPWIAPETATAPPKKQKQLDALAAGLDPGAQAEELVIYTLDAAGNRKQVKRVNGAATTIEPYTSDDANRYIKVGSDLLRYDATGNLSSDGHYQYFYDYANRLVRIHDPGSAKDVLRRSYDPLGRVATIQDDSGVRRLGHLGLQLVEERDDSNSPSRYVVNGPGIDDPVAIFGNQPNYPVTDLNGSVVACLNRDGKLHERIDIDAFGRVAAPVGGLSAPTTRDTADFQGRPWLAGAGLHDFRSRCYSADQGRFVQSDTIGLAGGLNLYQFGAGDPLLHADPLGTAPAQRGMGGGGGEPWLSHQSGWTNFFMGMFEGILMAGAPFLVLGATLGRMQGAGITSAAHGKRTGSDVLSELWQLHNMANPFVGIPLAIHHAMTTDDSNAKGQLIGGLLGGILLMSGGRVCSFFRGIRDKMRGTPRVGGYENLPPPRQPPTPAPVQPAPVQPAPPPQLSLNRLHQLGNRVRYGDHQFAADIPEMRNSSLSSALNAGRNSEFAIIGKDNPNTAPLSVVQQFRNARTNMQNAGLNVTSITELNQSQLGNLWSPHANFAWMEGIVQARSIVVLPHELNWFMQFPANVAQPFTFAVHEFHFFLSRGYTVQRSTLLGRWVMVPP